MTEAYLQAENLSFSYGKNLIFSDISFSANRGEITSIIGPNGSGKTTLLRVLCGLEKSRSGAVSFAGENIWSLSPRERARTFSVVRQRETNQFPFTCLEVILMGLHPYRSRFERTSEAMMKRVAEIMTLTDTLHLADKFVSAISGGEFQRVILARAIAQQPKVLFMDEAMSELDISARIHITKKIRMLAQEKGIAVVSINHDLNLVYQFSDRVYALNKGRMSVCGTPEAVLTAPFFEKDFRVKADIYPGKGFLALDEIIE